MKSPIALHAKVQTRLEENENLFWSDGHAGKYIWINFGATTLVAFTWYIQIMTGRKNMQAGRMLCRMLLYHLCILSIDKKIEKNSREACPIGRLCNTYISLAYYSCNVPSQSSLNFISQNLRPQHKDNFIFSSIFLNITLNLIVRYITIVCPSVKGGS